MNTFIYPSFLSCMVIPCETKVNTKPHVSAAFVNGFAQTHTFYPMILAPRFMNVIISGYKIFGAEILWQFLWHCLRKCCPTFIGH